MSEDSNHFDTCRIRRFIDAARGKEEATPEMESAVQRERGFAMSAAISGDTQVDRIRNLGISYGVDLTDREAAWLAEMWDEKEAVKGNPEIAWT